MTETAKSGIFAATAAALGLIAWVTMPQQVTSIKDDSQALVGKPIFEKFTDPSTAASLKIVKFDDDLGQLKPFELSREKASGAWVIPSHDSYPADASSQVSNVANSFIGLRILTVESMKADDQKLYGVVEPDISKLEVGDTGVGTLVEMKDDRGETLVDLIVGKTVRDDPKKRYVRRARTDAIYSAEFDIEPISTDFSRWIEGDLLKLTSNDIASLTIRDYNILPSAGGPGQLLKNFDAALEYSPRDAKWSAKEIKTYEQGKATERKLTDDEELNTVKINEIKNTLDNLKIVNVARKPKGLASDLKADKELLDDNTKIMSLFKKGFIPGQRADGGMELYSSNGELAVKLNDGVEYLLRFGKTTAGDAADEEGEKKEETAGVALNRTLFVTARLDESHYPMPDLQKVPETIEDLKALEAKEAPPETPNTGEANSTEPPAASDTKPENEAKPAADAKPAAEVKPEADSKPAAETSESILPTEPKVDADAAKKADAPKGDQSNNDQLPTATRLVRLQADAESKEAVAEKAPAADDVKAPAKKGKGKNKKTEDAKSSDAAASDKPVEEKPAEEKSAEEKPMAKADDKDASKPVVETEEELKERLEAARERITKENTRAIDERNDRLNEAKKKAGELNARFAEWYYEISDSEFKRLRASMEDLIKKKNATGAAAPPSNDMPAFPGGAPF